MILKMIKRSAIIIVPLICFFLTGCGSKTVMVEPRVTYGNPSQDHIRDIPQVRYKALSESIENKQLPEINADEYEKLGDALLSKGKYFMAYMQYENSLKKNKDNIRVEYKKGVSLLGGGRNEESQKIFKLILQKQPDFALAHEGMGRVNFKNKLYHIAKLNFEKAVDLNPLLWRSYAYLGNLYDLKKEYDLAVQEYKTALTIKPDAGYIHNNMGVSLYMYGRYKNAVDSFYQALRSNYNSKKVYNNLGRAFVALELYDNALEAFEKGGTKASAYNNIGVGYLKNGNTTKAAECFEKAIELSPRFYVLANENLKKCRLKQQ
ncbi:tetratricopeptide repeat protein [Desulfobacula phenolica]|uniref:Tetratricopeptide repeat-containing protein n=1 Tax=Desulfobacula phenolica TaxID=90732 RepID=A0A1H2ES82_9BACT|nr:tetratricopeptide repeat protein [Desulfobacula phenolica]SDT97967.1 Tetratricopeptide repeat-containing protein [Desulfobacula phenolica]